MDLACIAADGVEPMNAFPGRARLAPLVVATMASQALLVVLAPTMVTIGDDLGASIGAVGQARSITAGVAIAASIAIAGRIDVMGVPRLLGVGAGLAIVASVAVAVPQLSRRSWRRISSSDSPSPACFGRLRRGVRLLGRPQGVGDRLCAGANALAWIVVNPFVGAVNAAFSWRAAQNVPVMIALAALVMSRAAVSPPRGAAVQRLRTCLPSDPPAAGSEPSFLPTAPGLLC